MRYTNGLQKSIEADGCQYFNRDGWHRVIKRRPYVWTVLGDTPNLVEACFINRKDAVAHVHTQLEKRIVF